MVSFNRHIDQTAIRLPAQASSTGVVTFHFLSKHQFPKKKPNSTPIYIISKQGRLILSI